jgi:glutamate dehydrogenase
VFTPHDLIRTILLAPVELFWNGGIGTYVKSAKERQAEAFDRTNDPVRVDAEDLRCLIVGEGGNLGLTQRGRIAFARKGGRINTDSIDNSAGVDCSDHEVNIKILLGAVVDAGDMTGKQRDRLLAEMTDEVGQLVLRNNVLQAQAISLAEARPQEMLDSQAGFIRRLEASGRLNRALEMLPDEEELAQRRQLGQGLFRPEIAVLTSYGKMTLKEELIASSLPDEPYLLDKLVKYFPRVLRKRFASQIAGHRLRREITATLVANSLVNRGLGEFVSELGEHTGRSADEIARAYIVARDAFALVPLYGRLELLAGQLASDQEIVLLAQARDALARGTKWFLRNLPTPIDIRAGVDRFAPGIARVLGQLDRVLAQSQRQAFDEAVERYRTLGIEDELARALAALPYMFPACEVVAVADQVGVEVSDAAAIYFALDCCLCLGHLRDLLQSAQPGTTWGRLALTGLYDDLLEQHRRLAIQALTHGHLDAAVDGNHDLAEQRVQQWLDDDVAGIGRWQRVLAELDSQASTDLAMLAVVVRALSGLDCRKAA